MPPVKHKRLKCKTLDCAIPLVFLLHTAALLNEHKSKVKANVKQNQRFCATDIAFIIKLIKK